MDADLIVLGPGDLFTSLVPVLLVEGINEALAKSRAKRVFVVNLATKRGQTEGFTAKTFCDTVSSYISPAVLDVVVINSSTPPPEMVARYAQEGEFVATDDMDSAPYRIIRAPLLSEQPATAVQGDTLRRSFLRHDPAKLAQAILSV